MKPVMMCLALILAGCTTPVLIEEPNSKEVQVRGRTWTVTEDADTPNLFVASRDNNNLQPFGRPAALRTPQAVHALHLATGCRVVPGKIWQNTSAEYYAEMACPK